MNIKDCDALTPVEKHNNIFLKRDDLFMPYDDIPLSGGKVRQCIKLFNEVNENIKNEYNNTVYTYASSHSPQSIIVTRVAKEFNFNSKIFTPKNTKIENNILLQNVLYQGGVINNQSKVGYGSVMNNFMNNYSKQHKGFIISFGINVSEYRNALLGSVSEQVRNLPDLDYLIIPCGSCIMMSGILLGIKKYNKNIKHVIGVQISGYNKINIVKELTNNIDIEYEFLISKDYQYSKHLYHTIDNVDLDPLYESKAYDYILKYRPELLEDKSLNVGFWVVGNSIPVRSNVYKNVENVNMIDSSSYVDKKEILEDWD